MTTRNGSPPSLKNYRAESRRRWSTAATIAFTLTVLNFFVWGVVNSWIGGDALNGRRAHGKYYVAAKGRFTEVSRGVYLYSYAHTVSQFVMFGATLALGAWETFKTRNGTTG
jgi:hypothetical protein